MTYEQYLHRLREEMDEANSQAQAEYEWLGEGEPIEPDELLHPDKYEQALPSDEW